MFHAVAWQPPGILLYSSHPGLVARCLHICSEATRANQRFWCVANVFVCRRSPLVRVRTAVRPRDGLQAPDPQTPLLHSCAIMPRLRHWGLARTTAGLLIKFGVPPTFLLAIEFVFLQNGGMLSRDLDVVELFAGKGNLAAECQVPQHARLRILGVFLRECV